MILYHFTTSPFARRVRLALTHKHLPVELRDARADPSHLREVQRLNPMHTVPVLLDEGRALCDSNAILQYLERKQPSPPLWPAGLPGAEAFELSALADGAITIVSDLGMRYAAMHKEAYFPALRETIIGRVQRSLERLAERAAPRVGRTLCGDGWSAADLAVITLVQWLEGMPLRAPTFAPAAAVVALGWKLPGPLVAWADAQRARPDVIALG
jgi:glutathione S-transferase